MVERYTRRMARIERSAQRANAKDWVSARKELQDVYLRYGLASPFLPSGMARVIQATANGIQDAMTVTLLDAQFATSDFLAAQIGDDLAKEILATTQEEQAKLAQSIDVDSWALATEAAYRADIERLRQSGEDDSVAAAQLFAVGIEGAGGRASTYRRSSNNLDLWGAMALWAFVGGLSAAWYAEASKRSTVTYQKQAIAAIDERTTDCCLRVHGQIQDLDKPFVLTGTPRFSDKKQNPPFHWNCRTATALYRPEMEQVGLTTTQMRRAASAEMTARKDGSRVEIHPAHATSRR